MTHLAVREINIEIVDAQSRRAVDEVPHTQSEIAHAVKTGSPH